MYINKIEPKQVFELNNEIAIEEGSVSSKTLVQYGDVGVTLFSLDKNESISEHTSPGDALVIITEGTAEISIEGEKFILNSGQSIVMPANKPHALKAIEAFKMFLMVIKPEK